MENLIHATVVGIDGGPPVLFKFSNGATLQAEHWSLKESGQESVCSGEDHHHCSMPAPIDPVDELREILQSREVLDARSGGAAGGLVLSFEGYIELSMIVAD